MRSYYSHLGRPSVWPELMIRMLLVGYRYSIRSERRLTRDVDEAARDQVRALMTTEAYQRSRVRRKKIETLFAEFKHNLGMTRPGCVGLPAPGTSSCSPRPCRT